MDDKLWFSGCNRWANTGKYEEEPVGTATAMHECTGCPYLAVCKLKQENWVFPVTDEIAAQMDADYRDMTRLTGANVERTLFNECFNEQTR